MPGRTTSIATMCLRPFLRRYVDTLYRGISKHGPPQQGCDTVDMSLNLLVQASGRLSDPFHLSYLECQLFPAKSTFHSVNAAEVRLRGVLVVPALSHREPRPPPTALPVAPGTLLTDYSTVISEQNERAMPSSWPGAALPFDVSTGYHPSVDYGYVHAGCTLAVMNRTSGIRLQATPGSRPDTWPCPTGFGWNCNRPPSRNRSFWATSPGSTGSSTAWTP